MTHSHGSIYTAPSFQLTSSRRGWPRCRKLFMQVWYFNSHPHEEDDLVCCERLLDILISTHILTKRMTSSRFRISTLSEYFNSHPHEEDDDRAIGLVNKQVISTHILTKRMTVSFAIFLSSISFQLTSSRRGWRIHIICLPVSRYFNSHPHEEDDKKNDWKCRLHADISTHILTKRMTCQQMITDIYMIFQLTSSRRGWLCYFCQFFFCEYFNSHPHEEDDSILECINQEEHYFNSHPHEEDDFAERLFTINREDISTHILTKRMTDDAEYDIWAEVFQLTSSRRGWHSLRLLNCHANISTHILTKRMTGSVPGNPKGKSISTHILTKRMTISTICCVPE